MLTPQDPTGPAALGPSGSRTARRDLEIRLPLRRLFAPDADPSTRFPGETAVLDGFVVTPDRAITLALVASTPGAVAMLDTAWDAIQARGIGRRRRLFVDDRGRTVFVWTVAPAVPADTLDLLRTSLVVPAQAADGYADVHLSPPADRCSALEETLAHERIPPRSAPGGSGAAVQASGPLEPENWGFLGMLCAIGAFDASTAPRPEALADLLGLDLATIRRHAARVEVALDGLVTTLFAPPDPAPEPGGR
jgi:hypothetical protein